MSKKFKSQASSSRAASGALGGFGSPFGATHSSFSAFGSSAGAVSSLSYIAEPPDLSKISESNVVVGFKNLSKKDSTTKAKALEDLQDLVVRKAEDNATLEDGFLEAWVCWTTQIPSPPITGISNTDCVSTSSMCILVSQLIHLDECDRLRIQSMALSFQAQASAWPV